MFERYTENARRALFFARYEASAFGDLEIKPDHLLLGLLRTTAGTAARMLRGLDLSPDEIRRAIEQHIASREKVSTSVEMPFTIETKRILQSAAQEADNLLHRHIGTEHLLLAMLREEKSETTQILTRRGVRYGDMREAAEKMAAGRDQSSALTEVPAILAGINQLLDRLATIAGNEQAAQSLIDSIREQLKQLGQRFGE